MVRQGRTEPSWKEHISILKENIQIFHDGYGPSAFIILFGHV